MSAAARHRLPNQVRRGPGKSPQVVDARRIFVMKEPRTLEAALAFYCQRDLKDAHSAQADAMLLTPPEQCADDILDGMERGKRRILTGNKSSTMFWLSRLLPNSYPRVLKLFAK